MKTLLSIVFGLLLAPVMVFGFLCHAVAGAFVVGTELWGAFVDWVRS